MPRKEKGGEGRHGFSDEFRDFATRIKYASAYYLSFRSAAIDPRLSCRLILLRDGNNFRRGLARAAPCRDDKSDQMPAGLRTLEPFITRADVSHVSHVPARCLSAKKKYHQGHNFARIAPALFRSLPRANLSIEFYFLLVVPSALFCLLAVSLSLSLYSSFFKARRC